MITIIKFGTKKRATCSNCGCVFTYENEDTEKIYDKETDKTYKVVNCPQCNEPFHTTIMEYKNK